MTTPGELSHRSAAAIGRALAAGETNPVALTEYLLSKIEAGLSANVFLRVTRERALLAAAASERRLASGRASSALDGVPVAFKDLIDLAGERTTAGSDLYRDAAPAPRDATCAANLLAAGMVPLGKTNLTEFAYSGLGLNPHFGTPHNPHSPSLPRIPGGSSSGSGVGVAADLVPCAIGTDTGGSVRIPASFNGITGYKSSAGRIDRSGVFPLSHTLDTVGTLARSVEDCILLDMAMRAAVATEIRRLSLAGLRLFVPRTLVLDDLDTAVSDNFENSLASLEAAGVTVERGECEVFSRAVQLMAETGTILAAEAYFEHRTLVDGPDVNRVDQRVVARIRLGKKMRAVDLVALQRARVQLMSALSELVGDALIAMPTTAMTAPAIAPLEADDDLFHLANMKALRNTSLGNFLDLPGLALPNGLDADGLPTSFLLSALSGQDARLLSYGLEVERVLVQSILR